MHLPYTCYMLYSLQKVQLFTRNWFLLVYNTRLPSSDQAKCFCFGTNGRSKWRGQLPCLHAK